jgi:hypothetical protein
MDLVPELIYNDGLLATSEAPKQGKVPSEKKRGMQRGAKLMFFSGVIAPIALGLSILVDNPGPLLVPFTIFLAGLAWVLYFWLFGDDMSPVADRAHPRRYIAPQQRTSLPHSQDTPVTASPRRVNTSDMANPPTVTDHTTRLFDE